MVRAGVGLVTALALALSVTSVSLATPTTFSYTGGSQTWTVPSGVTSIEVTAIGASGEGAYGGFGGETQATVSVTAGNTVNVYVGGGGSGSTGGWNGGGSGNFGGSGDATGGGASDIRIGGTALADRVVVAGGGGGEPDPTCSFGTPGPVFGQGGSAGGLTGEQGGAGRGGSVGGGGGSQSAGGAQGSGFGSGGSLGQGGGSAFCGGDGGGGYYGGGSGGSISCSGCGGAGGGAGSSYADSSTTSNVTYTAGVGLGDGSVTISYGAGSGASPAGLAAETITPTGSPQDFVVPAGVTEITATLTGGEGGTVSSASGGLGGGEVATVPVSPGQIVAVIAGSAASGATGGFNGGGAGGFDGGGGGGGGASDILDAGIEHGDRVAVSGVGGGAAQHAGGAGGGLVGQAGASGTNYGPNLATGGGGGTQSAGGSGSGSFGNGGSWGAGADANDWAGGGGGGWYGGGSGGNTFDGQSGAGGGGSSFAESSALQSLTSTGVGSGDGSVTISTGSLGSMVPPSWERGTPNGAAPSLVLCCQQQGEPVDTLNGDFYETVTDASVASFGPPLVFKRSYDASLAQDQVTPASPGPLGYGWTDNWSASLDLSSLPDAITVNQDDGAQATFYAPVSGSCVSPYVGPGTTGTYCTLPVVTASLTYDSSSNTYTFITHPYLKYVFDGSGRLVSETSPGGAEATISYGTPSPGSGDCPSLASSCFTVTSASGRALVIAENSDSEITQVTDPLGRSWTYGYCSPPSSTCSSGDLVSVTDPNSNITSYSYDEGNSNPLLVHDLLKITYPNGQTGGPDAGTYLLNAYNSGGQITAQTTPAGNQTSFDYSNLDAPTGTGYTLVTDPDGNVTEYEFTNGLLTGRVLGYGTSTPSTWTYNRDSTTAEIDSTTDPNSNTTSSTYDSAGNVTSKTNALGNTWTYAYNAFDEQTCATLPLAANPCSSLSPPSAITGGGTVSPPSSAPPKYVTYSLYDTAGNPVWTTTGDYAPGGSSASQSRTSYSLDSGESVTLGGHSDSCAASPPSTSLPCLTIDPNAVVTQLGYDATTGDLTSASTPDGNSGSELAKTTYGYDSDGELTSVVAPDGNLSGATAANFTTTNTYTSDSQLSTVTVSQTGGSITARETQYGYDGDGNRTSMIDPRGKTTSYSYTADDQLDLVTDPDSQETLTCYDGDGEVSETVPPVGVAADSLTAASCPISTSTPDGYQTRLATDATTYAYDPLGDKQTITTPAPASLTGSETTTNGYDLAGQLLSTTAPPASTSSGAPSQVTNYAYDAAGELLTVQKEGSTTPHTAVSTTSYCYDPNGNKTASVAPDGNTSSVATCSTSSPYQTTSAYQTGYSYDSLGELVSKTTPSTSFATGPTWSYSYDPAGNLLTSENPDSVTQTNTYTPLDQLATVSYSDSTHSVSYGYDANGNRLSMVDASGTSSYGYDVFDELTSYENGAGKTVSYAYDADGDTTGVTYPLGSGASWASSDTVSYGYDDADELSSVTDFNGHTTTVGSTADGLPNSLSLGSSGDTVTTSYDPTDTPSLIKLANSSTTLQQFSYSDVPSGAIGSETDTPSSSVSPAAYTYDAQNRVTQLTPGSESAHTYAFDASGNATTLPNGATGTYDYASELTAGAMSGGPSAAYTYDAAGNRTASATTLPAYSGATASTGYSYNGAGELTQETDGRAPATDDAGTTFSPTVTLNGAYLHSAALGVLVAPAGATKPQIVQSAGVSADIGSTATVTLPATPAVGDVLVAFVAWTAAPGPFGDAPATPTGWTRITDIGGPATTDNAISGFYHVVASGETAKSFTFDVYDSGTDNSSAVVYEVTGQAATPIDSYGGATGDGTSVNPSFTSNVDNDLALLGVTADIQSGAPTISPSSEWALGQVTTVDSTRDDPLSTFTDTVGETFSPSVTFAGDDWSSSGVGVAVAPSGTTKPTVVQTADAETASGASTVTVTLPASPTAGNLELAYVSWQGWGDPPATPTGWTKLTDNLDGAGVANLTVFWRIVPSGASASTTFTVYDSSTSANSGAVIYEINGQAAGPIDNWAGTQGSWSSITPTLTTSQPNDLVIFGVVPYQQDEPPVLSQDHNWVLDQVTSINENDTPPLDTFSDRGATTISPTISFTGAYADSAAAAVLAAPSGSSTPTIVQSAGNSVPSSASITVTLGSTPTAGHVEVAFVSWQGAPSGFGDPPATPTGWTRILDAGNQGTSDVEVSAFERVVPSGASTSQTFDVYDDAISDTSAVIYELSGANTTTPIAAYSPATGDETSINPAIAAPAAHELVLIAASPDIQSADPSISPSTGWTLDHATNTDDSTFGPLDSYHNTSGTTAPATTEATGPRESSAYTYDGDGLRQTATTTPNSGTATTQNFTWNPTGSLPQLLMDSTNAYIYGPGNNTPTEQVNLATGTITYLISDLLGSVRGTVDSSGTLNATATYDAWGNPSNGGLTGQTPFGYAGSYTDPTGLTYNIGRYYDPTTGQFLTVDPLVDQTGQPYAYVSGDPVNALDPTGFDGLLGTGINLPSPNDVLQSTEGAVAGAYHVFARTANAALPYIREGAEVVQLGAGACALVTSETVIGGVTCGAISLAAGGVSAGAGVILNQEHRLSTAEAALGVASLGAGGLAEIARAASESATSAATTARILAYLSASDAEYAPGVVVLQPWVRMQLLAVEEHYLTETATLRGIWATYFESASLGVDIFGQGDAALEGFLASYGSRTC